MYKISSIFASLMLAVVFSLSLLGVGHTQEQEMKDMMMKKGKEMMGMTPTSDTNAAALRKNLNLLLAEHVWLAGAATNAALNGNQEEFEAAAAALDANSQAIAVANGVVYGQEAADAFLPLWRKHIGFIVDYTNAVAANDKDKQEKAVNDLISYSADFGAFINSASPSLPADAVAGLVKEHVVTFKAVIDAQAAGNDTEAYMNLRKAAAHMQKIADAHAEAIVLQFPDKFSDN
ncbi:MAG: hypothetical protein RIG61_02985 [Deltaproteobacteria bacterium]